VASGRDGGRGTLLGTLAAGSVIGLYYYLRIIEAMTASPLRTVAGRSSPGDPATGRPPGNAVPAARVLLLVGPDARRRRF